MYNLISRNRINIGWGFLLLLCLIAIIFFNYSEEIFSEINLYFYTFSTIVQSFVALVAFLGAVVVFKVQLEDQALAKLSDAVEISVHHYRGSYAKTYSPFQMLTECEQILEKEPVDYGSKELIRKVSKQMRETLNSRNEVRSKMVDFAALTFMNVAVALVSLLFSPILACYWAIGGIVLTLNIGFSLYCLNEALQVVRKTMGYDFSISL
jgi:hypothetical protein